MYSEASRALIATRLGSIHLHTGLGRWWYGVMGAASKGEAYQGNPWHSLASCQLSCRAAHGSPDDD